MGVYERDILDYLESKENKTCQFSELWEYLKKMPDITQDWLINDIKKLVKDALLTFNEETETLTLLPKATKPPVPMPPNCRR